MNKHLQKYAEKFIDEVLKEIVKDFTMKFINNLRFKNLRLLFNNKRIRILYTANVIIHIIFLTIKGFNIKFTLIYAVLSWFIYKTALQEIKEEYFRRKYQGISKMFSGKAKVIDLKENRQEGTKTYTIYCFIPRKKILENKADIEHYLNSNVINVIEDNYNKRLITIVTSKNPLSKKKQNIN
jgi:hypothetical protein